MSSSSPRVLSRASSPPSSRSSTTSAYVDRLRCLPAPRADVETRSKPLTHAQVLVDGPASSAEKAVPRHASPLSHLSLTPIVIPKLPRASRNGVVKKFWEASEVEKKFSESAWSKNKDRIAKRRALTDFERFKVMRLRKQVGYPRSEPPGWPGHRRCAVCTQCKDNHSGLVGEASLRTNNVLMTLY